METCSSCKFFQFGKDVFPNGHCTFYPPQAETGFPVISETNSCGQHRPTDAEQIAERKKFQAQMEEFRKQGRPGPKPEPPPQKPLNSLLPNNLREG